MKITLMWWCVMFAFIPSLFAQNTQKLKMPASAQSELRIAMDERHKAMLAGDGEIIERLTADEYVQTDVSGYVQDRSTWLNEYFRPLAMLH
jgi:uncharacterized protein YdeI (BOF family)